MQIPTQPVPVEVRHYIDRCIKEDFLEVIMRVCFKQLPEEVGHVISATKIYYF